MAAGGIKIEASSRGLPLVLAGLAGIAEKGPRWGEKTVNTAARLGAAAMRRVAPDGEDSQTGTRNEQRKHIKLKQRISHREARWHPGGPGGGGYWEATFGVRGMGIHPSEHDPAYILVHGSGVFATGIGAGGGVIRANAGGGAGNIVGRPPVMSFINDGQHWFPQWVRGQRPKDFWVRAGQGAAKAEIRRALVQFDSSFR